MMKSFFKKLAFVMALAMVVSLAAPAATTAAAAEELKIAYQNGSAITELNIAKVDGTEDLRFLGAKTMKEVEWTSSNPAVATVNEKGIVTAKADGTADITVTVDGLSATIKVYCVTPSENKATIGSQDGTQRSMSKFTMKVDEEFDFRFFGIKDYDAKRYDCTWLSLTPDVADVDKNGNVTAKAEGTAAITLSVTNKVIGKTYVVAPVVITVAADATPTPVNKDAFTVTQKDTDKFVLTFANDEKTVEDIVEKLSITLEIGEKEYPVSFENVSVDGKVVTITTYSLFEGGEVYTITYGECEKTHTVVLGGVASVGMTYYTGKNKDNKIAYVTEEEENDYVTFVPVLYDKYKNDITDKYNLAEFDFTYTVSENVLPAQVYNDTFAFGKAGLATVSITAAYIDAAGEFIEVKGEGVVPVQEYGKIGLAMDKASIAKMGALADDDIYTAKLTKLSSWTLDPNSAIWNSGRIATTFSYEDITRTDLVYTAVFTDNRGNTVTSHDGTYQYGTFYYESTNNNVLGVGTDGTVSLYAPGKANILVYFVPYDGTDVKKLVGSTQVVVLPETYPVTYKVLNPNETTASDVRTVDGDLNNITFKIQFYDQNGNVFKKDTLKNYIQVVARDVANVAPISAVGFDSSNGYYTVVLDGSDFDLKPSAASTDELLQKTFSYKVSLVTSDVTSTVKTPYAVFSLNVKNTQEECDILDDFITATAGGTRSGASALAGKNYKFNIAFGDGNSIDAVVKNVVGYVGQGGFAKVLVKDNWKTDITATYLSTGNLAIARVPEELFRDVTDVKTGEVGYVYYKVTAPTYTVVAGDKVANTAWSMDPAHGCLDFAFNTEAATPFKYAATGTYAATFYTTRLEGGYLYAAKTSTINVKNTQNEVKYVGLNPEFDGVCETIRVANSVDFGNIEAIVKEQLRFSFDEAVYGAFYDAEEDGWRNGTSTITLDWSDADNFKVSLSADGSVLTISRLAFKVKIDDGSNAYEYISIVPVGARIRIK